MISGTRTMLRAGLGQIRKNAGVTSAVRRKWFSTACETKFEQPTVKLNPSLQQSPYTLTEEQEYLITRGEIKREVKLHELLLKLYVKRQEEDCLPQELRLDDIFAMMDMGSAQLSRMLRYVLKRCSSRVKAEQRKEEAKTDLQAARNKREKERYDLEADHSWLQYGLFRNNLFPRVFKADINKFYDTYTSKAQLYGQKVIIDCSYESAMDDHRIKNTAKQILLCCTYNRRDRRPFSLHLCNVDSDCRLLYYLKKFNPVLEKDAAISIHSSSYVDLFERNNLVYLSPHATTLLNYNPNDIYILGGIVDKIQGLPLSNQKAVQDNIRCAALPLNHYVQWKQGTKCLCIHQVFNSLLVVKNTNDWSVALMQNVPHRKITRDTSKGNKEIELAQDEWFSSIM